MMFPSAATYRCARQRNHPSVIVNKTRSKQTRILLLYVACMAINQRSIHSIRAPVKGVNRGSGLSYHTSSLPAAARVCRPRVIKYRSDSAGKKLFPECRWAR